MTFIEDDNDAPTNAELYIYVFTSVIAAGCAIKSSSLFFRGRPHYHSAAFALRFGFPFSCLIFCVENVLLCFKGSAFYTSSGSRSFWLDAFFALHTILVPIWLTVTFEVCYLIHKRRSVNWCGIYFDEGHRVKSDLKSVFLRNWMRIISLLLLLIGIVVNFDLLEEGNIDVLAGRSGWWSVFFDDENSEDSDDGNVHLILSLIPILILFLTSFHHSISMWRYGTSKALVVYPSYFNPWVKQFLGTLFLGLGQLFNDSWYPSTSNIGQAIFILSLVLEMKEVDKELVAENEFQDFLDVVQEMGDNSLDGIGNSTKLKMPKTTNGSNGVSDVNAVRIEP